MGPAGAVAVTLVGGVESREPDGQCEPAPPSGAPEGGGHDWEDGAASGYMGGRSDCPGAGERPPQPPGDHFRESSPHQGERALEASGPFEAPCLRSSFCWNLDHVMGDRAGHRGRRCTPGLGRGHRAPATAGPVGVERADYRRLTPSSPSLVRKPQFPAVVWEGRGDAETRPPPPWPCSRLPADTSQAHTRHTHTHTAHAGTHMPSGMG